MDKTDKERIIHRIAAYLDSIVEQVRDGDVPDTYVQAEYILSEIKELAGYICQPEPSEKSVEAVAKIIKEQIIEPACKDGITDFILEGIIREEICKLCQPELTDLEAVYHALKIGEWKLARGMLKELLYPRPADN